MCSRALAHAIEVFASSVKQLVFPAASTRLSLARAFLSKNTGNLSTLSWCIRPATSLFPTANGFGTRCGDSRMTVRSRALEFHFMCAIRFWISSRNIVPNWRNFLRASSISGSYAMEQLPNWRDAGLKFMCDRPFIKA
jgi:hypothetical protein